MTPDGGKIVEEIGKLNRDGYYVWHWSGTEKFRITPKDGDKIVIATNGVYNADTGQKIMNFERTPG